MKRIIMVAGLALTTVALASCQEMENSDRKAALQQEQLSAEAHNQVGLPAIVNFQEKRMMKMIFELRDQTISTITYIQDMNGKLHKLCDSVGYGLPYATQYTNPEKIAYRSTNVGVLSLPQADPNGLFMPASADGTWVMCQNPANSKEVRPIFVEPRVITSPFPLKTD
jgi:hypothetical protein